MNKKILVGNKACKKNKKYPLGIYKGFEWRYVNEQENINSI